jgi:3-oxocholest-4-en-26-oate---CoA ligase
MKGEKMPCARWNYADVWEWLAERFPHQPALLHGSTVHSWCSFDRRADSIARVLLESGLGHQDKVALYCRNRPEYLESKLACFKASFVPVNTNFRYGPEELTYLWTDADVAGVIFDSEFTETCEQLHDTLPQVKAWIRVDTAGGGCPSWAIDYDVAAHLATERIVTPWSRSGDDLDLLYTGGTTGMPKGVMWPQHDLFLMLEEQSGRNPPEKADLDGYLSRITGAGPRVLLGPPLMHGTACWFAMAALSAAGSVVTLTEPHLDAEELLDTILACHVKGVCIVGDAFARPIISKLLQHPGKWDLRQVRLITSSGAMLSRESKERLLEFAPRARIVDGLGSSESGSLGSAISKTPGEAVTARFQLNGSVRVIDTEGRDVVPGSGQPGLLAVGGHIPLGYYGDKQKTSSTFVVLDNRRYVIAGDWANVETDGTITLLGRGSGCINTAGEKVFPEEVEEVLKRLGGVRDAAVVGVADEQFGEAVIGLVELEPGNTFNEAALIRHAKEHLARFKAPKAIIEVDAIVRHENGKMDYAAMRERAMSAVGDPRRKET